MTLNLDELEALLEKATERPWERCGSETGGCTCSLVWSAGDNSVLIHDAPSDEDGPVSSRKVADANLITAAVNALPELIAEVRLLRQRDADRPSITQEP